MSHIQVVGKSHREPEMTFITRKLVTRAGTKRSVEKDVPITLTD